MPVLFHGSSVKFDQFEISEDLVRTNISNLAEGLGIYLTDSIELAKGYGSYVYEVFVRHNNISDFTDRKSIEDILEKISQEFDIELSFYMDVEDIIERVLEGEASVTELYKEITDWLDSDESFYMEHQDLITHEEDCLFEKIKEFYLSNLKDVIKYYDKSFKKNIYICFKNPNNLEIRKIKEFD